MNTDPRCCRRADGMGKQGFHSKRAAKRYLRHLRAKVGHTTGYQVYRCDNCGQFHFGGGRR